MTQENILIVLIIMIIAILILIGIIFALTFKPKKKKIEKPVSVLSPGSRVFKVSFGSAFAVDQFGFVRKGVVAVGYESIQFSGKKRLSIWVQLSVFLLITLVPLLLFNVGLGWLLALVIIYYFCVSDNRMEIARSSITDVRRKGRQIRFCGKHPESGKMKKSVFTVSTEQEAMTLEKELLNKQGVNK